MRHLFLTTLVIPLVFLVELTPQISLLASSRYSTNPVLTIVWSAFSDPSPGFDVATAVCQAGDIIYVLGFFEEQEYDYAQRIEARSKQNGDLLFSWSYNPSNYYYFDFFYDCEVVSDKLIVVGADSTISSRGVIAKFSLDLTIEKYIPLAEHGLRIAASIISDGSHIYIAGIEAILRNNTAWYVEKRRISDLEVVAQYTSNPSHYNDWAMGIGLNPVNKHLWVVGDNYLKGVWRIEILDHSTLNQIKTIELQIDGFAIDVDFDEYGYAYVSGSGGVAKLDINGNLLKVVNNVDGYKILYVDGYVLVAAEKDSTQVLLVFDRELNLIYELVLSDASSGFTIGKMAYDGRYLYVAGFETTHQLRWTIYAISIYDKISATVTLTITKTVTERVIETITAIETITYTYPLQHTVTATYISEITRTIPYTFTVTYPLTIPYTTIWTSTEFITVPITHTVKSVEYVTDSFTTTIEVTVEKEVPLTITTKVTEKIKEENIPGTIVVSFIATVVALSSGIIYISFRKGSIGSTRQKEPKEKVELQQKIETVSKCQFCNNEIPLRARFCPYCGAYLEIEEGTRVYSEEASKKS